MATKKTITTATPKRSRGNVSKATNAKPVALTLKVDEKIYVRLCTLRAKERRTTQEILNEALLAHLKRLGA